MKIDSCLCKGKKFNDAKWKSKWPSCSNFTNGVTISDRDKVSKSPTLEMVGDRVLIERDGKSELVDASEIKAEYVKMLGLDKGNEHCHSVLNGTHNN